MASRHLLQELVRPLVDKLASEDSLRQRKATDFAVNQDGAINPMALTNVLPWLTATWYLSGATVVGNAQDREIRLPQNVIVKRIDVIAKTAPGAQNLLIRVRADGNEVDRVTVQKTQNSGSSSMNTPIAAGAILRVDTIQTGGSNITVCVHYVLDTGVL